ncbi:MAG: FAD:protein FMN transferase, partial [Armatimonadota bacterium]|nr:FAD:protein FMN transferase [Armatimonadota bacterium]
MGCRARIVLYARSERAAEKAARLAFERIAFLEDIMSDYRPTSEVMQLCSKAGGRHVPVSKELLFVLKESTELARRSDGAFDVTIGPLIKLWRESRKSGMLPSKDEIFKAKRLVGWRKIIIDEKAGTVKLATQGMRIDLGGIAKGYACDEAIKIL